MERFTVSAKNYMGLCKSFILIPDTILSRERFFLSLLFLCCSFCKTYKYNLTERWLYSFGIVPG